MTYQHTHQTGGHRFFVTEGDDIITVTLLDRDGSPTAHCRRAIVGGEQPADIIGRSCADIIAEIKWDWLEA